MPSRVFARAFALSHDGTAMPLRDAPREGWAIALLLAAATFIAAARSVLVSLTHDEAVTAGASLHAPISRIMAFTTSGLPDNNHLLFTLLARLSITVFGEHEWTLRLPSVLAGVLYGLAITALLRRFVAGNVLVLFVAAAVLNPALLEAMSLARGYGLGIALMCAGTYALLRALEAPPDARMTTRATALFALATLAHLTFVLYWVIAWVVLLVAGGMALRQRKESVAQLVARLRGSIVVAAVVTPMVVHQVIVLRRAGLLATEGVTSFLVDTVGGAAQQSLGVGLFRAPVIATIVAFIVCVPAALAIAARRLARAADASSLRCARDAAVVLALLVGASALSALQHHVFGGGYLSGRRAVSLVPLFVLACAALTGTVQRLVHGSRAVGVAAAVVCVGVLALQVRGITLDIAPTWRFDADTRRMMGDLRCLLATQKSDAPFRLATPWELTPAVNYYRTHPPVPRLAKADRGGLRAGFDAYYVPQTVAQANRLSLAAVAERVGPLRVIAHYPRADAVLAVPEASPLAGEQALAACGLLAAGR